MFKVAPLSSSFMMFSMLGFIISAYFLTNPIVKNWAWSFMIVFIIMFISSLISMTKTPVDDLSLEDLAIHKKGHYKKK